MQRNWTSIGNSLATVIKKPILELSDIAKDTPLEMKGNGEQLITETVRSARGKRLRVAAQMALKNHNVQFVNSPSDNGIRISTVSNALSLRWL